MKNLFIIFGGASVEHDVSIVTALQTYGNLKDKYKLGLLYCTKDNLIYLVDKTAPAEYIDKESLLKNTLKDEATVKVIIQNLIQYSFPSSILLTYIHSFL